VSREWTGSRQQRVAEDPCNCTSLPWCADPELWRSGKKFFIIVADLVIGCDKVWVGGHKEAVDCTNWGFITESVTAGRR
jgi:hypothetical protein